MVTLAFPPFHPPRWESLSQNPTAEETWRGLKDKNVENQWSSWCQVRAAGWVNPNPGMPRSSHGLSPSCPRKLCYVPDGARATPMSETGPEGSHMLVTATPTSPGSMGGVERMSQAAKRGSDCVSTSNSVLLGVGGSRQRGTAMAAVSGSHRAPDRRGGRRGTPRDLAAPRFTITALTPFDAFTWGQWIV